ncbi:hypothetical protein N9D07_03390 [Alphaproteobacteria bacterium]|nr:hypothetical protein [Alphaproteobacteria bacterium]
MFSKLKNVILTIPLILALVGCQTGAERQVSQTRANYAAAKTEVQRITRNSRSSYPEYFILKDSMGMTNAGPSFQQQMDSSFLTDTEASIIITALSGMASDRLGKMEQEVSVFPANMQHQVRLSGQQFYADLDTIYMRLVKKQISKGQAAIDRAAAYRSYQSRYAELSRIYDTAMSEQHAAELRQRSTALQRLQNNMYRQQLINSLNKPWYTSCQSYGNSFNCSTF